jgi:hypothetical protein
MRWVWRAHGGRMITVRPSKIPLLILCPPSHAAGMCIDGDNQPARAGTAAHKGGAQYAITGLHDSVQQLADEHGVEDVEDLGLLLAFVRQAVESLRENFPSPIVETKLAVQLADDVLLTGTPDMQSVFPDTVSTADYKSGWKHNDHYDQLRSYAILGTEVHDKPKATVSLVWLRDRKIDTRSITREELKPFKDQIVASARQVEAQNYRTGEHCQFCPRSHECPARHALVRQTVRDIAGIDIDRLLATPNLGEVYAGLKCIEKSCDDFRSALKMAVEQKGGEHVAADGSKFAFTEINKRELDPMKSWPVLSARLSPEAIAGSMKISLTKTLDAIGETAGKGMKGTVKEQLVNDLDAAGAITRHVEKRLQFTAGK